MRPQTAEEILASAGRYAREGRTFAVVTVTDVDRSAPRDPGAKMLVFPDGTSEGTIGGGPLEAMAIRKALACLEQGTPQKVTLNLDPATGKSIGMLCGGFVEIFIEVYRKGLDLLILGAGHCGQKIAEVAAAAGIAHSVVDDRPEYASAERFPAARRRIVGKFPQVLEDAPVSAQTHIAIVTRCHQFDRMCLEWAIRTKAAYIGLIGSTHKVNEIFRALGEKGLHPATDPRVFAPIGLDLGGRTPGEIAVSVVGEILKHHFGGSARHLRDLRPGEKVREAASLREGENRAPALQEGTRARNRL